MALSLAACTTVPEQLQGEFPDLAPTEVGPGVFGTRVRWGGVIVGRQHEDGTTCLEILGRELDKYLRPENEDYSPGRYIACKPGFQDPAVFAEGREVTTIGQIRNIRVRELDGFRYSYPVLDTDSLVLWEKRRKVVVYRGFHDPFYYRYPWGYPYWGWGYPRPFPHSSSTYAEERSLLPDPSVIESGESAVKPGDKD
ncbi:MAG: Slp family lipoprotein [Xanthomonadales bacterium]